ncbi:MAG TPA: hypothetical protein VNI77_08800 [Nitrososphaera sp.]|nr:hypothetical protein [Nitrososphaera sp.]
MSEEHRRLEQAASAIEDLLYMGAIRLSDSQDKALLSPHFSLIASNVMSNMKITDSRRDEIMRLMYFSLLIYMNEHLKVPRQLVMAIGNDLENNRESMQSGELVTTYVTVLSEIWSQNRHKLE